MLEKLDELNRILLAALKIRNGGGKIFEEALLEACRGTVVEGRMPDHAATLAFCVEIGFLTHAGDVVRVCAAGENFVELNPASVYELHDDQKALLVRTCYLGQPFEKKCRALFSVFAPSTTRGT